MLHLHRSERADSLVQALAQILGSAPADPFSRDLVAVPTRGMERWLTQQLSHRLGVSDQTAADGVCAAIDFPFPSRLLAEALTIGSEVDPDRDPWKADRLVWTLMEVFSELREEAWLAPLAHHLTAGSGPFGANSRMPQADGAGRSADRRYTRLRHLAGLYERYALNRPELITAWAAGTGGEHWQPELWRRVRERIGSPSGPERLQSTCRRLIDAPEEASLPPRLMFFGLTRLAALHVRLLGALAVHREVHLMLLHPSPALWTAVADAGPDRSSEPGEPGDDRASDHSARLVNNRLLASWGRDARELQLMLAPISSRAVDRHHPVPPPSRPPTLLGAVQAGIRDDRRPPGPPLTVSAPDERLVLDAGDDSIRVHACHGRTRQVTVLREAILHRLAADPTLEPRDVIVMCPDVEEFAPLIGATFGSAEPGEGELRVRLADRGLAQTNPLLAVAARLLELASARLTASEVLDLIDFAPVRRRFHLSDNDLARLHDWTVEAQIHWGLDGPHRGAWNLAAVDAGTWLRGLRRLLLSVAIADGASEPFGAVLPAAEIDSNDIALAGALAELIDRLATAIDALRGPMPVAGWVSALAAAVDGLADVPAQDGWQRHELTGLLESVASDAGGRSELRLSQAEARAVLAERLAGRPTRANFRTGHLTVCTLHPMRSIPHRVVCLLGIDDQAFPRHAPRDGDDLLGRAPCVGDRDPRSEDRQLLLDALMAAEEALIITYSGNDERTNTELPPAVPVGEFLDVIDATARAEEAPARRHVLIRHPLQPFDPRNFTPGQLEPHGAGRTKPWSFDSVALGGARILAGGAALPPAPFLSAALSDAPAEELVSLTDLIAFVERPARAFLRQRLQVSVTRWDDEISDSLPVEFNGLERWGVGQRLLEAVLSGEEWSAAINAEMARGTLPPGELARPIVREASGTAAEIAAHARTFTQHPARTHESNVLLGDGRRLTGIVSGVRDNIVLSVAYSRLNPRQRLAAWVRLLAITAAHPEVAWETVTLGRAAGQEGTVAIARIPPLAGSPEARETQARAELERLLSLRAEGLTRPFVAPAKTAEAFVAARATGRDPVEAASAEWRSEWSGDYWREREDAEPEHRLVFGVDLPLAGLERDAARLWDPLRARERMEAA